MTEPMTMADLRALAARVGVTVKDDQSISQCWGDRNLIHLLPEHENNPHVLAHELAHIVQHEERASWRYYPGRSTASRALRCEENIADMVADALTGLRRKWGGWPPVTGLTARYCEVHAQSVIEYLRKA
jgi:hypothetical protein